MKELSIQIRALREELELTQAELASRAGMLPAQLCRIETGRTDPSVGTVRRIADALGIPIAKLLDRGRNAENDLQQIMSQSACSNEPLLVRLVPSSVAKAARNAISEREKKYDSLVAGNSAAGTGLQLSFPFVNDVGGAETLARVMRSALGAGETTLADLSSMLDLNGVRVHFVSFRGGEPSVSFYDVTRGILSIAVQKGDTPERQTYRFAYELGAACVFASGGFKTVVDKESNHRFIRRFAAAFLMPEDGVRKIVAQCGLTRKSWTLPSLLALKVRFNVSAEAFALRLEELGLILPSLRNRFRDELRAYYAAHPKSMEPEPHLSPLRDSVRLEVGAHGGNIKERLAG